MQERVSGGRRSDRGPGDSVAHRGDDVVTGMPHLGVPHLDHDETGAFEALSAGGVMELVAQRGVVPLALHLDDQRPPRGAEVDPPTPLRVVAEVDPGGAIRRAKPLA